MLGYLCQTIPLRLKVPCSVSQLSFIQHDRSKWHRKQFFALDRLQYQKIFSRRKWFFEENSGDRKMVNKHFCLLLLVYDLILKTFATLSNKILYHFIYSNKTVWFAGDMPTWWVLWTTNQWVQMRLRRNWIWRRTLWHK